MNKSNYVFSAQTNKGIREYNQDSCLVTKNKSNQLLCVVCDGIGSEEHSEIASRTLTHIFEQKFLKRKKIHNFYRFYNSCIKKALKIIEDASKNIHETDEEKKIEKPKKIRIGSTICCLLITGDKAEMANLGDSRIYYYDVEKNTFFQKSYDHNVRNFLIKKFNDQKLKKPEMSSIIEQQKKIELEANSHQLLALTGCVESWHKYKPSDSYYKVVKNIKKNDEFVIVTDGVYNWVKTNTYLENQDANKIIQISLENGSNDNLTCCIIKNV